MKGKTASGFEFDFDESKLEEWEFLDIMADAESEDASVQLKASRDMVNFLLGKEEAKRLVAHIKQTNDGKAPTQTVFAEITAIMNACSAIKKSSSSLQ